MIQSKEDLRSYIEADLAMTHKQSYRLFIKWLTRSDEYYIRAFMFAWSRFHTYSGGGIIVD